MAVNPNETAYQQKPTAVNPNAQTGQKPTAAEPVAVQAAWANAQQNQTPPAQTAAPQQNAKETTQAGAKAVGSMIRGFVNNMAQNPQVVSAQTQSNAQTTQEATGNIYKVGSNGQGPKGMKVGDQVVTATGTYTVMAVNPDGSYQSKLTNANQTTGNYAGKYANAPVAPTNVYRVVPGTNNAPKGLKVGDQVVTGGGTYTITGVNADGSYQSKLTNPSQTTANYTGSYATAPGTAPATTPAAQTKQPEVPSFAKGYNPDLNYTTEIENARARGDLVAAAYYEQQRNAKIDAEGLGDKYAKTDLYSQYLSQLTPERQAQLSGGYVAQSITPPEFPMARLTDYLDQQKAAEIAAAQNEIAYNVEKSTNELKRQEEDAQPKFQQRLNQLDIDTARAMSNSALYAEARGDRGGIGQSQYNEIQAAALRNKQDINAERTKLSTDIARQIADLAAQGRFQERQQLLQISQNYLSQLFQLEKYNAEYGMSRAEFLQSAEQALRNYEIQRAQVTGEFEGQPTLAAQNAQKEWAAAAGELALKYGQMPTAEQLAAMGLTQEQAQGIIWQIQMESGFSGGGSSGGGGGSSGGGSRRGSGSGGSGSEDANVSSGQYAAATGWSNAAGAPAASAGAGATGGLVVQGSGGSGSSGSSGGGGLSTDQIKAVQRAIGVTADGIWGPQSQAAAGGLSASAAYSKYVGSGSSGRTVSHEDIDYKDASAVADAARAADAIRQMMLNGASKKEVAAKITELSKAGYISDDAARRLRAQNNQRP